MNREEWLRQIEPKWHEEFLRFVETGDASEEFLTYMDRTPACQQAVEAVFSEQAAEFESLSRDLRAAIPDTAPAAV